MSALPGPVETGASAGGFFVPGVLFAVAFVGWLGFQTYQLASERQQLEPMQASIQAPQDSAVKLRASLDALATATAKLANSGNANARLIVEELRKRGVTINPEGGGKPTP